MKALQSLLSAIIPILFTLLALAAVLRKADIFTAIRNGAKEGLSTAAGLIPSLVALFSVIYMFRASGAMDFFTDILRPAAQWIGIPAECVPILLIRPLSGSGALALGADIIRTHGVNSLIGRTAAVMLGSTETTFYVIAVYFGAADIKKTRHAVPAALVADLAGFCMAAVSTRLLFQFPVT
ncbi:MAG: spore maturation protein [Clostridiales bacterium]|nr:spore maturation protein [Clostridiales bacterium]